MSDAIAKIGLMPPGATLQKAAATRPKAPAAPVKDARTEKLEKAAGEFESIFVKQLLKESKIGGEQKAGGYGDMAVDALATGIQRGGGLGLAKQIEQALSRSHAHTAPAAGASPTPAGLVTPQHAAVPLQPATRTAKR